MKRILTIQDISCLGQCSLTVALPIISALGVEASVLPTAVLSTHTMFKNFTFADLTEEMPKIEKHWIDEGLKFDGFYTGYVGSIKQIEYISNIMDSCRKEDAINVVDPCMADHGKLYPGFAPEFPGEMLKLCKKADVIVPNLTEACFSTRFIAKTGRTALVSIAITCNITTMAVSTAASTRRSVSTVVLLALIKTSKIFFHHRL